VVVEGDAAGLPDMLTELVRGNLERDPSRVRLLEQPGFVNLSVTDAEVELGLQFGDGTLVIGAPHDEPELSFTCESEQLMSLTNVPLRFGMPDQMSPEGRQVSGWLMSGRIKVKGLPRYLPLMIRLQRLFTVAT
jgi:hypothetical protein